MFDGKQLEGAAAIFALFVRTGAEDKMEKLSDILKPAELESIFGRCKPLNVKIHLSDLEIMKCLMSDPRMRIEDIAKKTSLSTKTVTRRLEKMRENHILQFTILIDPSSMQLTGFIKLILLINVHSYYHQYIVQRIYNEMQEYLLHPLDDVVHYPINYSFSCQNAHIFASFGCANISAVNMILRRLESYEGVNKVEPITFASEVRVHLDWIKSEINRRIASEKNPSSLLYMF